MTTIPTSIDQAEDFLRHLLDELVTAKAEADAAARRVRGLRLLIDGYVTVWPALRTIIPDGVLPAPTPTRKRRNL